MSLFLRQKRQQRKSGEIYSFDELKKITAQMLYEYTEPSVQDTYLGWQGYLEQEEYRRMISDCIRNCSVGNIGARENVLELMENFLTGELKLDRQQLHRIIPFTEPERMTPWQKLEAMIFYLNKQKENSGYECLCRKSGWTKNGFVITKDEVEAAYRELSPEFSFKEEISVLVQLLFASTIGLGVIDTLNQQKGYIEEIQIGMSGKSSRMYNYRDVFSEDAEEIRNRYGIHIMAEGNIIRLEAVSFGTEEELQRVLRNMIKGAGGGELTQKNPMMVVDTIDGRRIAVSRPPMTDAWIGLIRKFDTVGKVSLEKLCEGSPSFLPGLLRQMVRSGRNMAITGEMASGKTTLLRACLAEIQNDRNLRIIESESFELNVRGFLPNANTVTMRITEQTPAEEVLSFARKTTGQIFAIGEINSAAVAGMTMNLSKIASQLFFSAHYLSTEHMISDFVNVKLCDGGYADEGLAEAEVVRFLGFDVHLCTKEGKRYVQYINEVIPERNPEDGNGQCFQIRPIYRYDEEKEQGVLVNAPGYISYEKARQWLGRNEYMEFVNFFEKEVS